MASTFLEPGGDADFSTTFWTIESGAPVVATDFVHGSHIKSYKYPTGATAPTLGARGVAVEAGGRFSSWIYLNALPTATNTIMSLCQATFSLFFCSPYSVPSIANSVAMLTIHTLTKNHTLIFFNKTA